MDTTMCPKCGSDRIIPRVRVMDRGEAGMDAGDLSLVIYEKPDSGFLRGKHKGTLAARVCGACGYVELYLDDPRSFYEIWDRREPSAGPGPSRDRMN